MFLHVLWLICFHASSMLDPLIDATLHAYITYVILGFACSNLYVCVYMSHACMDLHVFGYVYTWNNDSHVEYVWMWFSSPWCLVYWFAYLPLCDCYFMSPRVLIDWWLQDANLEFTCLFGSICLLHCLWLQFIWYVVFISFSSGYFFFDKHFPLDIRMFSCHLHRWYCGFIIP